MDAMGAWGFGVLCYCQCCVIPWLVHWIESGLIKNLTLLELCLIVVVVTIWRDRFKKVTFHCDNMGIVTVINNVSASSFPVVRLLLHLVLACVLLILGS